MKKILKIISGLLLIVGVSACSRGMDLSLILEAIGVTNNYIIKVDTANIKGFIDIPNNNATAFNYTLTGDFADSHICAVTILTKTGHRVSGAPIGTTYGGAIEILCGISAGHGPYRGTVSMSTTSGGNNYNGGIAITMR
ncbi:hypothetical protein [Francisella hispaniensis]|uniref:Lipoprotein n=1 Tax=Francisella hispaniensis FSC454 TaxID=1088883 RepID=A0AAC9NPH7_9GAMM|nr:hypothetical protein [Francisella hispaniensis]APD50082.1 hypothetical protein FSC454_02465 [Francisella hispaniensis FSC454]KYW87911.1 hypothetical protein AUF42_09150 [Francisella hispaniensis FSC454]